MTNYHSHSNTIQSIIQINKKLEVFWKNSDGWASDSTAIFMSVARLDWQSSLSRTLNIYLDERVRKEEGGLILAWVNLGALVEGTMKLFLSVFLEDYQNELKKQGGIKNIVKKGRLIQPDELKFETLKKFIKHRVFDGSIRANVWSTWIDRIQHLRNGIHAYQNRDIGTFTEFFDSLEQYKLFLEEVDSLLPYP